MLLDIRCNFFLGTWARHRRVLFLNSLVVLLAYSSWWHLSSIQRSLCFSFQSLSVLRICPKQCNTFNSLYLPRCYSWKKGIFQSKCNHCDESNRFPEAVQLRKPFPFTLPSTYLFPTNATKQMKGSVISDSLNFLYTGQFYSFNTSHFHRTASITK